MRARIRLAPPLRRSPSAPYPGVRRTDPRGSRSLWFWRQVSGSRRFNRGSGVFAVLIPTGPRWTSDFDTNAHHRRLLTAAAWRGLEPAPGSGLRRAFLHLSCSWCTIGLFIANLPFLRLRRTLDGPMASHDHGQAFGWQAQRRALVAFQGEDVIGLLIEDCPGDVALAADRVDGHDGAFESHQVEQLRNGDDRVG